MPIKKRPDTNTVWPDFFDYFRKDFGREIKGWFFIFKYYGMLTPLMILLLIGIFMYVDPIPPKKAYLATGQQGTSYRQLSEKFADYFAKHGYELVLVETPGLDEGFQKLNDDKSPVNASFLTAGSAKAEDYPDLRSLGSVQFSPIWLFYRGQEINSGNFRSALDELKVAVGVKGSNTHKILNKLLELNGLKASEHANNLIQLTHQKAVEEFTNGNLDAVFIVDGIDAPNIQKLLAMPDTKIYNFDLIDAYVKKLPFLQKVVVPRGSIDIPTVFPANDTDLLSSTVTLLVESTTHPVHQWLFLMAARQISNDRNQFFASPGYFPAYLDQSIPLSVEAKQYYSTGLPTIFEYFPLAIASLLDSAWVLLITMIALVYPLFKFFSNWRGFPSKKLLGDYWQDIREIEEDLVDAKTPEELEHYLAEINDLEKDIRSRWFDDSELGGFYSMRLSAIRQIRSAHTARMDAMRAEQEQSKN